MCDAEKKTMIKVDYYDVLKRIRPDVYRGCVELSTALAENTRMRLYKTNVDIDIDDIISQLAVEAERAIIALVARNF